MSITRVTFQVGKETLVGNIVTNNMGDQPRLLFIHGAGTASRDRTLALALKLAENNISSFAFDLSGHGESTGKLEESSLVKRAIEAKEALKFLTKESSIGICAFSMGGHVALELLKTNPIKALILFAPAIYDKEAFEVPFNKNFSEIIRKHESWKKADVVNALEDFTGNLLICIGDKDEVIPGGVIDMIYSKQNVPMQKSWL